MSMKLPVTPMVSVSLFFTGVTWASTLPYAGIMAVDVLGIDNQSYALLMTISSIVGALASVALGYFSDKVRDRRLIVIGCGLLGVTALLSAAGHLARARGAARPALGRPRGHRALAAGGVAAAHGRPPSRPPGGAAPRSRQ